jgi:hypothetical protein
MIIRAKTIPKVFSFSCDGCASEFLETDTYSFDRAMMTFRAERWVNSTPLGGGKQLHYCPGCAKRMGID